ncbi:hypothetical protein E1265_23850 [Streptomyces sp. 8K308]|uniref:hypothetical protein n=1 Tax=Streptomyces sp. 8K308 TaxID=2530388 RepID=UPI00104577D5|nr:hypothetical protein [Streptomyces sp. 8K308]TDC19504.1 hypothetical protein E1265_23850 [Streptomyces sp. 8K308]
MRHIRLALPALVLALGLTACGGGEDTDEDALAAGSGGGNGQRDQEATLDWYDCMRENGVELEDPDPNQMAIRLPEGSQNDPEVRAAMQACQDVLPNGGPGGGQSLTAEQIESLRAFTECMRENDIDMADPDANGRLGMPANADPQGAEFQAAMEECQPLAAGAPMMFGGPPSGGGQ